MIRKPKDAGKEGRAAAKACQFCRIAAGAAKGVSVYRDEVSAAFLDYRPLAIGHVLLVPLAHYATLDEVPDRAMEALAVRAKRLSRAVITALEAQGSFIALNNVVSQAVPHVHVHIVPRRKGDGLFASGYIWKRVAYKNDTERERVAGRIRAALAKD
jgi:histidine triad (HIT) family protein